MQKIRRSSESILLRLFDLLRPRHRGDPLFPQLVENGVDEFLVDQREGCAELFLGAWALVELESDAEGVWSAGVVLLTGSPGSALCIRDKASSVNLCNDSLNFLI